MIRIVILTKFSQWQHQNPIVGHSLEGGCNIFLASELLLVSIIISHVIRDGLSTETTDRIMLPTKLMNVLIGTIVSTPIVFSEVTFLDRKENCVNLTTQYCS